MTAKSLILIFSILLFVFPVNGIAEPASSLAVITINNSENVTFLNHTSSEKNGNWIVLDGGTDVKIPKMIFHYEGVSSPAYEKNGRTINITSPASYGVQYPFGTHQMFANNSHVNATFYNSSDFTGNIDIYLAVTYPTELIDIAGKMLDGNTTPFRNLLARSVSFQNQSISDPINFGMLSAGDYVVITMLNETNPNNLTIASATTFQVLEHNLTASASGSVQRGNYLDVSLDLDAPRTNYTYGAFLIRDTVFNNLHIRLRSNGTKAGTNLTADGEYLVDAFKIAGTGLNRVNRSTIRDIAEGIIGDKEGSVVLKTAGNSTSISFITDDLNPGSYILSVGVWSNRQGERLVGFAQRDVKVVVKQQSRSKSGGGGGGGGSVATSEPFDNVEWYETREGHLIAGQPVTYSFTSGESGIYEMELTGKQNEIDVAVRIEYLKGPSKQVKEPVAGIPECYVNIYSSTKKLDEVTVRFRVKNSWISSNDLTGSDVTMVRWDGNKWDRLETAEKSKDGNYTYFEAKTYAFSSFAITGLKEIEAPAVTPATNVEEPVQAAAETEQPEEKPPVRNTTAYVSAIVISVILVSALVYVLYRRQGKTK